MLQGLAYRIFDAGEVESQAGVGSTLPEKSTMNGEISNEALGRDLLHRPV